MTERQSKFSQIEVPRGTVIPQMVRTLAPNATTQHPGLLGMEVISLFKQEESLRDPRVVRGVFSINGGEGILVLTETSSTGDQKRYYPQVAVTEALKDQVERLHGMPVGVVIGNKRQEERSINDTVTIHPEILIPPVNPDLRRKIGLRRTPLVDLLGSLAVVVFEGEVIGNGSFIKTSGDTTISFPEHPHLGKEHVSDTVRVIGQIVGDEGEVKPLNVVEIGSRPLKAAVAQFSQLSRENPLDYQAIREDGANVWKMAQRITGISAQKLREEFLARYSSLPDEQRALLINPDTTLAQKINGFRKDECIQEERRIEIMPHQEVYRMIMRMAQEIHDPSMFEMATQAMDDYWRVNLESHPNRFSQFVSTVISARISELQREGDHSTARDILEQTVRTSQQIDTQQAAKNVYDILIAATTSFANGEKKMQSLVELSTDVLARLTYRSNHFDNKYVLDDSVGTLEALKKELPDNARKTIELIIRVMRHSLFDRGMGGE